MSLLHYIYKTIIIMKRILTVLVFIFALIQTTKAQVITCVPCNQLGMVMNVGSQETSISIYHSGQYMTHPREYNVFVWEFSDLQGNLLHQDTLVDASTISFGHSWSLTDTVDVTVTLVNDSAILPNGNSINCLFEDQIFWYIDTFPNGTPYGSWTFIHDNPGVDQNTQTSIDNHSVNNKSLIISVILSRGLLVIIDHFIILIDYFFTAQNSFVTP